LGYNLTKESLNPEKNVIGGMFMNLVLSIAKMLGLKVLPTDAAEYFASKIERQINEEQADRDELKELSQWSNEKLNTYIPDVYQKSIYEIDYDKLKNAGIKLLSFDIDDTIDDVLINNLQARLPFLSFTVPEDAKVLFQKLKEKNFIVALVTNGKYPLAKGAFEALGTVDCYIAEAEKPGTRSFEALAEKYQLQPSEMAHIGNNMRDDVAGGNKFGATTCLVRRAGTAMKLAKLAKSTIGLPTKGHLIREELLERDLWRKHHKYKKKDQYYQLGEVPAYRNIIHE
jgi:predicted HAD superfamily phosphohydrolase YqeG